MSPINLYNVVFELKEGNNDKIGMLLYCKHDLFNMVDLHS